MEVNEYDLIPNPRVINSESGDDIYIQIVIGNSQIGGNNISYDGNEILKGDLSQKAFLGTSEDLSNKDLDVITNVLDVNPATNNCVITTTFSNQENQVLFSKVDKGEAPLNGITQFKGVYKVQLVVLLFTALSFFTTDLFAQNTTDLDFTDLEMPSSPGLILLEQAPTSIENPTTPQGLGVSLLNFQQNGGAIEITPYWLMDHSNDFVENEFKNAFSNIFKSFSISTASVVTDSSSYLSIGFRTRILQIYKSENELNRIKSDLQNELSKAVLDLNKIEILRKEFADHYLKPVFSLDIAAATAGSSIDNSYSDLELSRWAAWLTMNWRPKGDDFYITFQSKYLKNASFEKAKIESDNLDLGSKLNYDIGLFTLSAEYLQRFNFTTEEYDDFRIVGAGNYKITDDIYLTASFGKNFSEVDNIVAIAGLNFGFSKSKIKASTSN